MATLQSSLAVPDLRLPTLEAWHSFITSLKFTDIGPFVGQTSAALVRVYPDLHRSEQSVANKVLEFLLQHASSLGTYADELADLSTLPGLATLSTSLRLSRPPISFESRLSAILHRIDSDNESVCLRGLCDLELLLGQEVRQMRELSAGDTFDHLLGCVVKSVISSAIRSGDAWPTVRDLAFECLGAIGALDPDRLEIPADKATFVLQNNFAHTEENMEFAVDFIQHVLVRAYQSSNDTKHQSALAYSIQQLLKVCQFTPAMLSTDPAKSASISLSVLNRWKRLPKTVVETLAPLLTSRFEVKLSTSTLPTSRPVYSHKSSYRDWIRDWSLDMINHVISSSAKAIFTSFLSVVKTGDVGIARKLVPHLVLHLVISEQQKEALHSEILEVLQDQVRVTPHLPPEPRLLCAQVS